MPIAVVCGNCQVRFKVPESVAGRKLQCKKCGAVLAIPVPDVATAFDASLPDRFTVVLPGDDTQYGPVSRSDLDTWLSEGRLDQTTEIWQEGSADWRSAAAFYPELDPLNAPSEEPLVAKVLKMPDVPPPSVSAVPPAARPPATAPVKPDTPRLEPGRPTAPSGPMAVTAPSVGPVVPAPGASVAPTPAPVVNQPTAAVPTGPAPMGTATAGPSAAGLASPGTAPTASGPIGGPRPGAVGTAPVGPIKVGPVGTAQPPQAVGDVGTHLAPAATAPVIGAPVAGSVARPTGIGDAPVIAPIPTGPANPAFQFNIDTSVAGRMKMGRTVVRRVNKSGQPSPGRKAPGRPAGAANADGTDADESRAEGGKSRLTAGLLGFFLGGFGVHNFYLGNTSRAILQIVVTVFTCGIGGLWGVFEGVLLLVGKTTTDAAGNPLV